MCGLGWPEGGARIWARRSQPRNSNQRREVLSITLGERSTQFVLPNLSWPTKRASRRRQCAQHRLITPVRGPLEILVGRSGGPCSRRKFSGVDSGMQGGFPGPDFDGAISAHRRRRAASRPCAPESGHPARRTGSLYNRGRSRPWCAFRRGLKRSRPAPGPSR